MTGALDILRARRCPWASLLALPVVALLWQSFFWFDRFPVACRVAYAGLTLLSALRPAQGLLAIAALATLGGPIALMVGAPQGRAAEPLILAFLVGWLVRSIVRRESILDQDDSLSAPLALFALAVSASLVVVSVAVQSATAPPWQFIRLITGLLARDYFRLTHFETQNWDPAALLLEGVLLMAAVLQVTRRRPDLQAAVARMLAIGIVAAAVLSLSRLGTALVRGADPGAFLLYALTSLRLSVHTSDFNAAGSHFVLALPLLWVLGIMAGRWRPAWWLAAGAVIAALWLTGSRSAQFSILLTLAAVMAVGAGRRAIARLALVAVALVALVYAIIVSRPGPEASIVATLENRWLFLQLSWDMLKSAPLFGVGIAEYWNLSKVWMPDGLRALYAAENAHNNFAQIGVELGVAGLGLFLWVLESAWRRARQALPADADPLFRGLLLGLVATLLTFLTGHPLLIGAFVCSFWIALGLAVARADALAGRSASPGQPLSIRDGRQPSGRWRSRAAAIIALIIFVSVPFRARLASDHVDLSRTRYGFAEGSVDPVSNARFDWAGPRATMFVPADAQSLYLSASPAAGEDGVDLELIVDGRLANRVVLRDGLWLDMRLILPVTKSTRAFRRIDLAVRRSSGDYPLGSPARDSNDPRVRLRNVGAK